MFHSFPVLTKYGKGFKVNDRSIFVRKEVRYMGTKICPICDSPVNSINFCKTCKRFVTPIENNHTFYLNERRSDVDYQRDYNFDGDAYDYSADKKEVEDTVSDCHDEFEFGRDERKDFHDEFGSDHNEDYNWQEEQKTYSGKQDGKIKSTEGEWKSWQNRTPGTPYNTGKKKKKAFVIAIIGAIFGLCCEFLPVIFDHIKDDSYESDTEDEYIEDDTYTEWDEEDVDDASLVAPDGYMYYTAPGEKQGSDGNYYTALSAEKVSEDGGECTLVGHYDGVTMTDFESDMLAGAQDMGIDLQADEYGRYLGLYKYDDGNTCYEKKDTFYADMGFLRVAVYGDYNSDRIHSLMIAQKIQDDNDYYRMDDIYTIIANALDEPDLESGSGYDSIIAGLHTLRDATDTSDETGNNYTEVHVGEWEISVSRMGGYLYIDLYVNK